MALESGRKRRGPAAPRYVAALVAGRIWALTQVCLAKEGVPSVYSPMARTLDDLVYFTKSFIGMKPWEVAVHPIPWRYDALDAASAKPLRIGYMTTDGVADSPTHHLLSNVASPLPLSEKPVTPLWSCPRKLPSPQQPP